MNFDIAHEGRTTLAVDYAGALDLGYPAALAGAALKGAATHQVAEFADASRAKLATRSAGKLAEYRIKEEIACSPATASQAELDLLSREAKARGTNRTGLIGQIARQAAAYRQIALLIGALEAEAGAAITAIPDDAADIETRIHTVLGAAKAQAEAAFVEAVALINGGS
tara:strand:- start:35 stop:541 length:507 start_codon:yes stop_codon:yes gene_type:complete